MLKKLIGFSSLLALASCGTIVNGPTQQVCITSNPSSGAVIVDEEFMGYTPLTVRLTRKDTHTVRIEVPGFEPYQVRFTRAMSGWVFGNLAFAGFAGIAVDAISGGLYRLTPNRVQAEMRGEDLAFM